MKMDHIEAFKVCVCHEANDHNFSYKVLRTSAKFRGTKTYVAQEQSWNAKSDHRKTQR